MARRAPLLLGLLAILLSVGHACRLRWLCDDAFISFRYARNLVEGNGLVFNVGERVEGFTNPLWTLWIALGLRLGATAERWSIVSGVCAHAASVALLVRAHLRLRERLGVASVTLPFGALVAALHVDAATYATGGLEGAAFSMFVLAALVVLVEDELTPRRAALSGLLLSLATLTRHDGLLLVGLAAAWIHGRDRRSLRFLLPYLGAFLVVFGPFTAARVGYYGGFFPNTYYAKSGNLAWWSQGAFYAWTFLERSWVVPLGVIAVAVAAVRLRTSAAHRALFPAMAIGFVSAAAYGLWVVKVGGDFMYARTLLPILGPCLLAIDAALLGLLPDRWPAAAAIAGTCAIGGALTPCPISSDRPLRGVQDERAYYDEPQVAWLEGQARAVAPFVEGLPLRVAIYGSQARLAYRARVAVVIEAHAGLTDAYVAHLPLIARGRVGHEKHAPFSYLVLDRKAHLTFSDVPTLELDLDAYIPRVTARLGGVPARLLHWDPAMVAALRARGGQIDDYPALLDALIARLPTMDRAAVAAEYDRARHFYFAHVSDAGREAAFVRRLRP